MIDEAMSWVFWFGVAAFGYSDIAAVVRYVQHLRQGALVMASQAKLQVVISTAGLMLLWYLHRTWMPQ
jgi:hypothetical protein